jgi:hypothetical protein
MKKGEESNFEGFFFNFDKKFDFFLRNERWERRKEGITERGNDWNDTTSAVFKNLVIFMAMGKNFHWHPLAAIGTIGPCSGIEQFLGEKIINLPVGEHVLRQ